MKKVLCFEVSYLSSVIMKNNNEKANTTTLFFPPASQIAVKLVRARSIRNKYCYILISST
ncbi:hypothetical protein Scep_019378 [Stephania cephalantha]|uniref:Uncharacterized protein n=1 Tax=Stephania cephalantha TaxID=152367 RepID=A0AAP0IAK3_9MAGN